MPKIVFRPSWPIPKRGYHLLSFEPCRINRQRAEPEFIQPTLHHVLPLRPACLDKLIHPRALGGQVLGRSTLGIGHALCQKWVYDQHYGLPLAKRFYNNKPPTILDLPVDMKWAALDIPDPETPVGARGIG